MERKSIILGVLSLSFATAFFFLTRFMRTLPYGVNDFDLILIGIALVDVILFAWAVVLGLIGLVLGIVGIFRKPLPVYLFNRAFRSRWVPAIGAVANILALVLVGFALRG